MNLREEPKIAKKFNWMIVCLVGLAMCILMYLIILQW